MSRSIALIVGRGRAVGADSCGTNRMAGAGDASDRCPAAWDFAYAAGHAT